MLETIKDPIAITYITFDLTPWLAPDEIITTLDVSVSDGLSSVQKSISEDGKKIVAGISGGTLHDVYRLSFIWESDIGRKDKRSILITMEDR